MQLTRYVLFPLATMLAASAASAQTAHWHASGPFGNSQFGYRVCALDDVDADGIPDVAVGTPSDYSAGATRGAVRVVSGADGSPIYTLWGTDYASFGFSVSSTSDIDGDGVRELVVGAMSDGLAGLDAGAAHVYSGVAGSFLFSVTGDDPGDWFGWSVAGLGDVDGDGAGDIAVGAPYDDAHGVDSGSVRLVSGASLMVLGTVPGTSAGDQFGWSLASAGDFNGDGIPDLIAGAILADLSAADGGAAYVLSGASGGILRVFAGSGANDLLGRAVAGGEDFNGDGFDDVLVGAPFNDSAGPNRGTLYVIPGAASGAPAPLLSITGLDDSDAFGWSADVLGDVTGDGVPDIVAGAIGGDGLAMDSGTAYLLSGATGSPVVEFQGQGTLEYFGESCARAGDVNLDGYEDVLVGAYYEGGGIPIGRGGAWLFSGRDCPPTNYCTAKVNSLGCTPVIEAFGLPMLSGGTDNLHVVASNVHNSKNGFLFWGGAPAAIPFGGGTLCIAPPHVRTTVQNSGGTLPPGADCSGTYDFPFTQAHMSAKGVSVGDTVYCQYWSRDPGFAPPNNVGLTAGLFFSICF